MEAYPNDGGTYAANEAHEVLSTTELRNCFNAGAERCVSIAETGGSSHGGSRPVIRALHRTVYGDGRTKYGIIRVLTVP